MTNLTDVCERSGTIKDCDLDAAENVNSGRMPVGMTVLSQNMSD